MTIVITGGSGFIGRHVIERLLADNHAVHALGRRTPHPDVEFSPWDGLSGAAPHAALEGAGAVIHLAGEPIAQRWNAAVKQRIAESRVTGTRNLVAGVTACERRPPVLVSSSAIGFYDETGDAPVTELSPPGNGFLSRLCVEWEREAEAASQLGVRVVRLRTGIVLGREGGALAEMLGPFKMGVGGPLASGKQWMSWIHIHDLVEAILFLIRSAASGAVNGTSPNAVRNTEFAHELGHVLHRPAVMHVPKFALRLRFGELAGFMLESQRVVPEVLVRSGFAFRFPHLRPALDDLLH